MQVIISKEEKNLQEKRLNVLTRISNIQVELSNLTKDQAKLLQNLEEDFDLQTSLFYSNAIANLNEELKALLKEYETLLKVETLIQVSNLK